MAVEFKSGCKIVTGPCFSHEMVKWMKFRTFNPIKCIESSFKRKCTIFQSEMPFSNQMSGVTSFF